MALHDIDQQDQDGTPFPSGTRALAAAATVVAPFISVVVASVLLSSESDPARRADLRTWRTFSAVWLAIGAIIAIVAFFAVVGAVTGADASGACRGGRDPMQPATYFNDDGKHWTATYECYNGGSTTVPVPKNRVP